MKPTRLMVVLVAGAIAGGASACGGATRGAEHQSPTSVLTREEIARAPVTTAYDALQRLRPSFIRPHVTGGRPPTDYAVVFINGTRRGSVDILRTIAASTIAEIRYLTSADASMKYGLDVGAGVLDVQLSGIP